MSFGENVSFYRKGLKITQEELAERLFVSRQTVSRWETDSALPDVETIIKLCELFGCDMDTLVRGDAAMSEEDRDENDTPQRDLRREYSTHMNKICALVAAGVGLILLGISTMLLLFHFGVNDISCVITLLIFIGIAVGFFIPAGIFSDSFTKNTPEIPPYPAKEKKRGTRTATVVISFAIGFIFLGLILLISLCGDESRYPANLSPDSWEYLCVSIFMFIVAISAVLFVVSGFLFSKYDTDGYNKERKKETSKKFSDALCGAVMLLATAIFLLFGFICNSWHPAWVSFPVGGIICAIISTIADAVRQE